MERGTLRERDRLFVRKASLVDFEMVDRGMLSISAYTCMHHGRGSVIPIDISLLNHITFPQLVFLLSY